MSEGHYLKKLSLDMGQAEYEMYRAIPAEEIGWENPAHHMTYDEWRQYLQDNISRETIYKVDNNDVTISFVQVSFIMYLDDYPIGLGMIRLRYREGKADGYARVPYVIRPVCRGSGLGITILELLEQEAAKYNVSVLAGSVNKHNIASQKTLEHRGFVFIKAVGSSRYYEKKLGETE
jgi:predicted acetyltransferase